MKRIVVEVDENLHRRLKTYCSSKGETIKEEIIALVCGVLETGESESIPESPEGEKKRENSSFVFDSESGKLEPKPKNPETSGFEVKKFRKALGVQSLKEWLFEEVS